MVRQPRRRRPAPAPRFDVLEPRALLNGAPGPSGMDLSHDLLLRFRDDTTAAERSTLLGELGAAVVQALPDGTDRVALGAGVDPDAAVKVLEASHAVDYAERDGATYRVASTVPNDPQFSQQWGLSNPNGIDINAPRAWDVTTGNPATVVAVIDSGIDFRHPDLASQLWVNPAAATDGRGDVHGWNFLNNTSNINDDDGHGTHVAGIIAAAGNNGIGVAGVDWGARLMILKTIDANGNGSIDAAVQAIDYAVQHGARVINASWDGPDYDPALANAIRYAGQNNVVVVVAAGNESANDDLIPSYPASFRGPNEISVAAVDQNGNLASFSNFGTGTVAIAAPGVDIRSTYLHHGYATLSGTSMAAPFVTGVVALVAGAHPDYSASRLVDTILSTARPLPSLTGLVSTGGIVDAAHALGVGLAPASTPTPPVPAPVPVPVATPVPVVAPVASVADVYASFLSVPEYYAVHGGTDAGYVVALYRSILGRDPEPGGLVYWLGALQGGASREAVARGILASPEATRTEVARWYLNDLQRPETLDQLKNDPGVPGWAARLG